MQKLVLALLKLYQKYLSPINFGVHTCRYCPSCSDYTYQAVQKYGVSKGLFLGILRVLRCNPFFRGGHDPLL